MRTINQIVLDVMIIKQKYGLSTKAISMESGVSTTILFALLSETKKSATRRPSIDALEAWVQKFKD